MVELNVTQAEADALIAMPKVRANEAVWNFPGPGGSVSVPLLSENKRENFLLDVSRGQINLFKSTYQNRARQVVILVRLDVNGSPHYNPDGKRMSCPHLHLYREGFGDKWAFPIPRMASSSALMTDGKHYKTSWTIVISYIHRTSIRG